MSDSLLTNIEQAGLYQAPLASRKNLEGTAGKLQLQTFSTDLAECRTIDRVLEQLGRTLHFPDWYGSNFDALYDCLTDSEWSAGSGYLLLIDGLDSLRLADPESFATLLEVFRAAIETHRETGIPFWILLDTSAPDIAALPTE